MAMVAHVWLLRELNRSPMDARITDSTLIALGGLIGVVALLFLLITKFKWHVFIEAASTQATKS